jgi:hypothetical protein
MSKDSVKAFSKIASAELARVGERKRGIEDVQNYLRQFGYTREGEGLAALRAAEVDDITSEALMAFQAFHGLPITGEFDSATKDVMTKPRCGHPDMRSGIAFSTACAWNQRGITYAFRNGTDDITAQQEFQAVRNAFRTWASIVPFTFTEVGITGYHEIEIDWRNATDPDYNMVGSTIAHADYPFGCDFVTRTFPKPLHFDDSEHLWAIGSVTNALDVESVALHEIGHILGLQHSSVSGAVMAPSISQNFTQRSLHNDDIAGIRRLYSYPPVADAWALRRLDIFGLGTDEAMYHKAWDGSSWRPSITDWERLGGVLRSPLSAVSWAPNRLDIFGLGTDKAMYHKWFDGGWGPSITDWER